MGTVQDCCQNIALPSLWIYRCVLQISFYIYCQAFDLSVDESSFTGETEPASKVTETGTSDKGTGISHRTNIAFMGTLVRCGNGKVSINMLE